MTMNLFVTGGAGFIGTNFIRLAIERGYSVTNFDALTYAGKKENLSEFEEGKYYTFIHGDICNVDAVKSALNSASFDAVINFAAESHVDRSIYAARVFTETNAIGAATLVEAAREAGVPTFIQISTDEVYGSLGAEGKFTLESPLKPSSPYSASKTAGDLVVMSFYHTWGYDVRITRCTNNYGPYQFPEKFIPLTITNALQKKNIPVYGDGLNVRDWIFVRDHCEGVLSVLERGKAGTTYLFGGAKELANIDLCRTVLAETARQNSGSIEEAMATITYVTDRPGHDRRYAIDWSESEKELGWKPATSFDEGIAETIRWYIHNQHWWKNA